MIKGAQNEIKLKDDALKNWARKYNSKIKIHQNEAEITLKFGKRKSKSQVKIQCARKNWEQNKGREYNMVFIM